MRKPFSANFSLHGSGRGRRRLPPTLALKGFHLLPAAICSKGVPPLTSGRCSDNYHIGLHLAFLLDNADIAPEREGSRQTVGLAPLALKRLSAVLRAPVLLCLKGAETPGAIKRIKTRNMRGRLTNRETSHLTRRAASTGLLAALAHLFKSSSLIWGRWIWIWHNARAQMHSRYRPARWSAGDASQPSGVI